MMQDQQHIEGAPASKQADMLSVTVDDEQV